MAELNYETIENGYDNNLERSGSVVGGADVGSVVQGTPSPEIVDKTITSGKELKDLWIENWIKSQNYKPGAYGFMIDGKTGNVEFGNGYFRGDITGASGTFSGTITATAGSIGGWTISTAAIYKDGATANVSSGMASSDYPFYAGAKYADRATAPFRVTPAGAATFTSISITGGVIDGTSTLGGRLASTLASAINLAGELITTNLNTSAKQILGDFTFGASGAIRMITDVNNGLWISPTGILGKKAGVNTFTVDIAGNATFAGTLSSASGTFGTITSGTLTGITITGGTIQTSSGTTKRIVISSNQMLIYNDSNVLVGTFEGITGTYASAIDSSTIRTSFIGFTTDAIGDPFALGANFDGAVGSRAGGVFLSGRLDNAGGGDPIELIPATDQGVICYGPIIFSGLTAHPAATEGTVYYNSTVHKLYVRTNAAWEEVAFV